MKSLPFHWDDADAAHLADALHRAAGHGPTIAAAVVAFALAAFALLWAGASTEWMLLAVVAGGFAPLAVRQARRRQIAAFLRYHAPCQVIAEWDDSGFGTIGCRHFGPVRTGWSTIARVIETRRYLILLAEHGPWFLPLRVLTTSEIDDLRTHFATHRIERIVVSSEA